MSTNKQELAAAIMVDNGKNASKAMRDAGYSDATARTPSKLTSSQGFQTLLDAYGLTLELIVEAFVEDIRTKPGKRKAELELAAKLRGLFKVAEDANQTRPQPSIALVEFVGDTP